MGSIGQRAGRGNILELLDVFIDPQNAEQDCVKVVKKIRPNWNADDLKFKPCPGAGFLNTMLICYTDEEADDWIIFRIFGGQFEGLDTKTDILATKTFHAAGVSPFIHCIFKNGTCMEYVKGSQYTWTELADFRDIKICKSVAREIAFFHRKEVTDLAIKFGCDIEEANKTVRAEKVIANFFENWPEEIGEKSADELFKAAIPPLATYKKEYDELYPIIRKQHPNLLFTHGELNPTNLIYNEKTDRAVLVDYDFSDFGFYTWDLAAFIEFSAVGMSPDADGTLRHSDDFIKEILREYLLTKRAIGEFDHDVTDIDVQRLFVQTMKCVLFVYLTYSLGFVFVGKQREDKHGVTKKDWIGLAYLLFSWYTKHKDEILAMEEPPLDLAKQKQKDCTKHGPGLLATVQRQGTELKALTEKHHKELEAMAERHEKELLALL